MEPRRLLAWTLLGCLAAAATPAEAAFEEIPTGGFLAGFTPVSRAPLAVSGTQFAVVGGWDGSGIHPNVQYWDSTDPLGDVIKDPMPEALMWASAEAVGGRVFIFGGYKADGTTSDKIYRYDLTTGGVSELAVTLPSGRALMASVTDGAFVYLIGGEEDGAQAGLDEILKFDPTTNAVTTMPTTLPVGREGAAVTWFNGSAYIFGGDSTVGGVSVPKSDILRYFPGNGSIFTEPVAMPSPLLGHVAWHDDEDLYFAGGIDEALSGTPAYFAKAWHYDMDDGLIIELGEPFAQATVFAGYEPVGNGLYVFGGENDGGATDATLLQWINTGPEADFTWTPEEPWEEPRADTKTRFNDTSIDLQPGSITGWAWWFGDVDTPTPQSTLQHPVYIYDKGGMMTVTLIVSDDAGTRDSIRKTFRVLDPETTEPETLPGGDGSTSGPSGGGEGTGASADGDNDGVDDAKDTCPGVFDVDQGDTDGDGTGDACDEDDDNDGVPDRDDNCPQVANKGQADTDGDGIGDDCEGDQDGDGVPDGADNCVETPNKDQADLDGDRIGDACDRDLDGDGVPNGIDAFPLDPKEQRDTDGDGIGDHADPDVDGDGVPDDQERGRSAAGPAPAVTTTPSAKDTPAPGALVVALVAFALVARRRP